jgi:hypothetical protein
MHRELTRRQMQERSLEGPDPNNPLERQGRFFLGLVDILECLADALRHRRVASRATVLPSNVSAGSFHH